MKNRVSLAIAAACIILLGISRVTGAVQLMINGNETTTVQQIIANNMQVRLVAAGLLAVGILLIISGVILFWRKNRSSLTFCLAALVLFFSGGLINGTIMFGHPLLKGQLMNFSIVAVITVLLMFGKPALQGKKNMP